MNLQIVPFDVAKDLKELGFDWRTLFAYDPNELLRPPWEMDAEDLYEDDSYTKNSDFVNGFITAPTQPEVCKWLRDEKGIMIGMDYDRRANVWFADIDTSNKNIFIEEKTYESAELEGIKKAIEILKQEED